MTNHPGTVYKSRSTMALRHILLLAILFIAGPKSSLAATAPESGLDTTILLTIRASGSEEPSNAAFTFTRSALENLPQRTMRTKTPWTDGTPEFSGPLVNDVLKAAGRRGKILHCIALNDYTVEIPIEVIERYQVILAMKQEGRPMSVRDKGPLWLIFPWTDHPDLWTETFFTRSIWQLKEIRLLP